MSSPLWAGYFGARAVFSKYHRRGLKQRLGMDLGGDVGSGGGVWVHGASAGEVLAVRRLLDLLRGELGDVSFVVSSLTPTGVDAARRHYPFAHVRFAPLDVGLVVERTFSAFRPRLLVLAEGDMWPSLVCRFAARGCSVVVVNGRFSDASMRWYRRLGVVFRHVFGAVSLFCVQGEDDAQRLSAFGVPAERVVVTGNMKYDNLEIFSDEDRQAVRRRLGVNPEEAVLVGGSTHAGEEEVVLEWAIKHAGVRVILVPRYPSRAAEVEKMARRMGLGNVAVYSRLGEGADYWRVLVVDVMGELQKIYGAADVAFVGGSLVKRGGQNVMEPAAAGVVSVTGPHVFNFRKEVELLDGAGVCISVKGRESLHSRLDVLFSDMESTRRLGEKARCIVLEKRGAAEVTCKRILSLIQE